MFIRNSVFYVLSKHIRRGEDPVETWKEPVFEKAYTPGGPREN